ncbi:hypothetical protein FJY63_15065, partial [Candidatus Sumerlaeota bacterium]|nr:hypothetical protein [Candidatus Sumerlaeota bacterium]
DRVRKFELQYKEGEEWRTFASGKTIGSSLILKFSPVTARVVRLNIVESGEGPTIWRFDLFAPQK